MARSRSQPLLAAVAIIALFAPASEAMPFWSWPSSAKVSHLPVFKSWATAPQKECKTIIDVRAMLARH